MLYQLSYASPSHRKTAPGNFSSSRSRSTDTLPLRAYHGTKIKVSTPAPAEQTNGCQRPCPKTGPKNSVEPDAIPQMHLGIEKQER